VACVERKVFSGGGERFLTYACGCVEEPPAFAAVGGSARVVATGSAHDRAGRLRKNIPEVIELLRHLQAKIDAHAEEMALVEAEIVPGANTLIVSYGISARAARAASRRMNREGRRVSFLQLLTLFPIPAEAIRRAGEGCSKVVVVEENMQGLYASVLEPHIGSDRLVRVTGLGRMITPSEIAEAA
jgi:2-oxoglutarate ferredoxin oxidoreductase subunit alpha